ncbi:MAG: hypothetical protein ABI439_12880 [Rhodospirillales bacterium]
MTLCIIWQEQGTIKFASDSRLSFGEVLVGDFGIKICRVPFNIYDATESNGKKTLITSGDLGFAFAGSALGSLIIKEAISELIAELQGIAGHHQTDMYGISQFIFKAYEAISKDVCAALAKNGLTCIVFSGYCQKAEKLRTFRMETNISNQSSINEILLENTFEVIGSGAEPAKKLLPSAKISQADAINALKNIIEDKSIADVGGHIQYGSFINNRFQPAGVASVDDDDLINYWRGPFDLNAAYFNNDDGLIPNFPLLDLIK